MIMVHFLIKVTPPSLLNLLAMTLFISVFSSYSTPILCVLCESTDAMVAYRPLLKVLEQTTLKAVTYFGKTSNTTQEIQANLRKRNTIVMVSAFASTSDPTSSKIDPNSCW